MFLRFEDKVLPCSAKPTKNEASPSSYQINRTCNHEHTLRIQGRSSCDAQGKRAPPRHSQCSQIHLRSGERDGRGLPDYQPMPPSSDNGPLRMETRRHIRSHRISSFQVSAMPMGRPAWLDDRTCAIYLHRLSFVHGQPPSCAHLALQSFFRYN